jgi:hypothetical protein
VQKGWIIGGSKNEPSDLQLLEDVFLRLVPKLQVLLFPENVLLS